MTRAGAEAAEELGRVLRRLRLRQQMTQQALADALPVKRATFSQWETGRHLPSREHIEALDQLLASGGELARTLEVVPSTRSVYEVFAQIGHHLVKELARDAQGRPLGWRRDFGKRPPSPLTTASGVRLLTLIDTPFVDLAGLARSLVAMEDKGGGWGARGFSGRPEVTALVMDALARIGHPLDLGRLLPVLSKQTTPQALGQTHVTSEVLRSLAPLDPKGSLTAKAVKALLETQIAPGIWPEKRPGRAGILPVSSPAHTARAVIALGTYRESGGDKQIDEVARSIDAATTWLTTQTGRFYPVRENLEPSPDDPDYGDLEIRHFTGALVAQALLRFHPTAKDSIDQAIDSVWRVYSREAGLWFWPNGDTPIWMQHEGVLAIMLFLQRHHHAPSADRSADRAPVQDT